MDTITAGINEKYQPGLTSSFFNVSQNLSKFLSDFANLQQFNFILDPYLNIIAGNTLTNWICTGLTNVVYNSTSQYSTLSLNSNGSVKFDIAPFVQPNTQYTFIVYTDCPVSGAVKIFADGVSASQVFDLNNNLAINSASQILEQSSTIQKHLVQFVTNSTAVSGSIYVGLKNNSASALNIKVRYTLAYQGLVEIAGLPYLNLANYLFNADTVDGFHASQSPTGSQIPALTDGIFPTGISMFRTSVPTGNDCNNFITPNAYFYWNTANGSFLNTPRGTAASGSNKIFVVTNWGTSGSNIAQHFTYLYPSNTEIGMYYRLYDTTYGWGTWRKIYHSGNSDPAGVVKMWYGSAVGLFDGSGTGISGTSMEDWQLCNGNNGSPDMRNRMPIGAGSSYSLGASGGESNHTLTVTEMPNHNHSPLYVDGSNRDSGDAGPLILTTFLENNGIQTSTNSYTGYTGGGLPHNNLPPYKAIYFIYKYQ